MAKLEFRGKTYSDPKTIASILHDNKIPFESWGVRALEDRSVEGVLGAYAEDVNRLKNERGYVTEDVIALDPNLPNLDTLLAKFSEEHHHTDDEVRFVVDGEGVFEINVTENERIKFTAQ